MYTVIGPHILILSQDQCNIWAAQDSKRSTTATGPGHRLWRHGEPGTGGRKKMRGLGPSPMVKGLADDWWLLPRWAFFLEMGIVLTMICEMTVRWLVSRSQRWYRIMTVVCIFIIGYYILYTFIKVSLYFILPLIVKSYHYLSDISAVSWGFGWWCCQWWHKALEPASNVVPNIVPNIYVWVFRCPQRKRLRS